MCVYIYAQTDSQSSRTYWRGASEGKVYLADVYWDSVIFHLILNIRKFRKLTISEILQFIDFINVNLFYYYSGIIATTKFRKLTRKYYNL